MTQSLSGTPLKYSTENVASGNTVRIKDYGYVYVGTQTKAWFRTEDSLNAQKFREQMNIKLGSSGTVVYVKITYDNAKTVYGVQYGQPQKATEVDNYRIEYHLIDKEPVGIDDAILIAVVIIALILVVTIVWVVYVVVDAAKQLGPPVTIAVGLIFLVIVAVVIIAIFGSGKLSHKKTSISVGK